MHTAIYSTLISHTEHISHSTQPSHHTLHISHTLHTIFNSCITDTLQNVMHPSHHKLTQNITHSHLVSLSLSSFDLLCSVRGLHYLLLNRLFGVWVFEDKVHNGLLDSKQIIILHLVTKLFQTRSQHCRPLTQFTKVSISLTFIFVQYLFQFCCSKRPL